MELASSPRVGMPSSPSEAIESSHSATILTLVILSIFPIADMGHPIGVLHVPADGFAKTLLKGDNGMPAELALDLGAVDGITAVVPKAVPDVTNQRAGFAHDVQEGMGKVEVGTLVPAANVVNLA